jgi:hypothetical protein
MLGHSKMLRKFSSNPHQNPWQKYWVKKTTCKQASMIISPKQRQSDMLYLLNSQSTKGCNKDWMAAQCDEWLRMALQTFIFITAACFFLSYRLYIQIHIISVRFFFSYNFSQKSMGSHHSDALETNRTDCGGSTVHQLSK